MKNKILSLAIAILALSLLICASAFVVSASEETPTVSIDRFNLTFESDTYIKYAVKFSDVDESQITRANTGMLYWTSPQDSYEIGSESSSSEIIGYTTIEDEKYYTFSYDKFSAKQMTDYIYSVAYIIIDGEYYYSAPVKYSILTYAYDKLGYTGEASESETLRDMLNSLLTYGALAQKYFNYKTDRLADDDFYQVSLEGGVLDDGFTKGLYLEGENVTITAPATDESGGEFAAWVNLDGEELSTEATATITVIATNDTYTATYNESELGTEGLVYTLQDDDTYSVTGYTGTATEVVIPSTYEGKPVMSIGFYAFEYCTTLTSIEVPDSVTSIGDFAFGGCFSLTSMEIPDSVISIGSTPFFECISLTRIKVDLGNPSYKDIDGNLYTKDGETLIQYAAGKTDTSFTIPDSVINIGLGALSACLNLTSIEIPDSVTSIGDIAFYYCDSLTSIEIPDSVTSIGDYAFDGCSSLTGIEIPDSVTSIGEGAFYGCFSLTSIKYRGTEVQWKAISKGSRWDYNTGDYTITFGYDK